MLLFLTTNMAAVTSRANQQLEEPIVTLATIALRGTCRKWWEKGFRTGAGIGVRNTHVRTLRKNIKDLSLMNENKEKEQKYAM